MLSIGYAKCHLEALHAERRYVECRSAQNMPRTNTIAFLSTRVCVFASLLQFITTVCLGWGANPDPVLFVYFY
jgi:hypothetical protein